MWFAYSPFVPNVSNVLRWSTSAKESVQNSTSLQGSDTQCIQLLHSEKLWVLVSRVLGEPVKSN